MPILRQTQSQKNRPEGVDRHAFCMHTHLMSNAYRAKKLRNSINYLAQELTLCTTPAMIRCVKQSIRSLELELTALELQ
jgi:hypothetical protein